MQTEKSRKDIKLGSGTELITWTVSIGTWEEAVDVSSPRKRKLGLAVQVRLSSLFVCANPIQPPNTVTGTSKYRKAKLYQRGS